MNFAIVGAGLSGLSTAFYLSRYADARVSVYEAAPVFGGRANVVDESEHCARLFLNDYTHLLEILKHIKLADGRTIHQTLQPVERFYHSEKRGWLAISHLYPLLAKEIPLRDKVGELSLRDKVRSVAARRSSPLLAAHDVGVNTNRYGSRKNYSLASLARIGANLLRSRTAYALEGPTDAWLVGPWIRHLEQQGVTVLGRTAVNSIGLHAEGVSVRSDRGAEFYDAVVITAFVPDMVCLLARSGIEHSVRELSHTHCKCFTLTLDAREPILKRTRPALYTHGGLNVVLQPGGDRCVVLCTRTPSTEREYVAARVRECLRLEHSFVEIKERDNLGEDEALYTADYVDPAQVMRRGHPHVYFAGSYIRNSYPVDSGEGAARTALNTVRQMERRYGLASALR